MSSLVAGDTMLDSSQHRENRAQGASSASKQNMPASKQKRAGRVALL
jgi:hypothetical protein